MLIEVVLLNGARKPVAYVLEPGQTTARAQAFFDRRMKDKDPRVRMADVRRSYEIDDERPYWAKREAIRRFRDDTRVLRSPRSGRIPFTPLKTRDAAKPGDEEGIRE